MSASSSTAGDRAESGVDKNVCSSVLVGVDGSPCAENALRWAVDKSATLGMVTPITAFQPPTSLDILGRRRSATDPATDRAAAEAQLRQIASDVDPGLVERAGVIEAHPGLGLVEAARDHDLLVVGTRGRGGVTAALLGSVSTYCVTHATVPVAVIPPDAASTAPLRTIVVGIDGSANAQTALNWAFEHVDRGGTVYAVGAGSVFGLMAGEFDPPPEELERHLRRVVEESVARFGPSTGGGFEVVIAVDPIDARVALPRIAAEVGADLLVLGARGISGIPYLVLGSVSTALVHHPARPTVIVPIDRD